MAKSESFLETYFSDCQTEMRWRREVEYKLIASLFPLCPALIGGLFALNAILPPHAVMFAAIVMTFFVWFLYYYAVKPKITAEHGVYESLGKIVATIWDYFDLFAEGSYLERKSILQEKSREYGIGPGYKFTLRIFRGMNIFTTAALLAIGLFAELGGAKVSGARAFDEAARHAIQVAHRADPKTKEWKVYSLEWRPDHKEYEIVVLREGHQDGYSFTLNPDTQAVANLRTTDIRGPVAANVTVGIAEAQERLRLLGYYGSTVDGRRGSLTISALKRFQRDRGLQATGEADAKTLCLLVADACSKGQERRSSDDAAEQQPSCTTQVAPNPHPTPRPASSRC
jgi:hypothetical protein